MRLENKVVILTGASSGVGYEAALLFAKEGATVYAVARRAERLNQLVQESEKQNLAGKVISAPGSVTEQADIDALFARVQEEQGRLDVLVNNAGLLDDFEPVGDLSDEMMEKVINVNVMGPFRMIRAAVQLMKPGATIVSTGSIAAIRGGKAGTAYTVSKHALLGLTRSTAAMYVQKGIRCNIVLPGGIETEMVEGLEGKSMYGLGVVGKSAQIVEGMAKPLEIAHALLFLASDDSANINGSALVSDGGLTVF